MVAGFLASCLMAVLLTMDLRIEQDEREFKNFSMLCRDIRSLSANNKHYFSGSARHSHDRLHAAFAKLYEHTDPTNGIELGVQQLLSKAHKYDFDARLPANGYRSIVKVVTKCAMKILQLCRYITSTRESLLFRRGHYGRELTAYVTSLGQLRAVSYYLEKLMHYCGEGELFPDEESMEEDVYRHAERLMMEVENLALDCFYGRCLGFQFSSSMGRSLATITMAMIAFSEGYLSDSSSTVMRFANSIYGGGKYLMDPELRGEKVVDVTRNCDIEFCKAFWAMNENDVMHTLPLFICPPVAVDKPIVIPPDVLELPTDKHGSVYIHPPSAHTGIGPVNCRLISYTFRQGQEAWKVQGTGSNTVPKPLASGLVIHFHGGGFVAQSSASHEVYLRHWAKELDVPIFSVDYSLAPENPFPRQMEECLYAYCWALLNCQVLGSTGERIVMVGDSAGGNLALVTSMRAATYNLRVPDGIVSIYGSMLIRYTPSPSRTLSLMDPLLPMGILCRCLAAYTGMTEPVGVNAPMGASLTKNVLISHSKSKTDTCMNEVIDETEIIPETSSAVRVHFKDGKSPVAQNPISPEEPTGIDIDAQPLKSILRKCKFDKRETCTKESPEENMEEMTPQSDTNQLAENVSLDRLNHETVSPYVIKNRINNKSNKQCSSDVNGNADDVQSITKFSKQHSVENSNKSRPNLTLDLTLVVPNISAIGRSPTVPGGLSAPIESPEQFYSPIASPVYFNPVAATTPDYAKVKPVAESPAQQFRHLPLSRNPFMSPYLADIELLAGIPPVHFICCHLDPLLDDSIMFAKRLRDMDKEVYIDVLEDLPHGFLNFSLISREAHNGSRLCTKRIKTILQLSGK